MDYYSILGPLLRLLPAETAHQAAIAALQSGLIPKASAKSYPTLSQKLWGLEFSNPVGLAAGFDKNGEVVPQLLGQGFGFVEAGTVTPKPQPGNPKPRMFRLEEDEAVINRLGFNSRGIDYFLAHFRKEYAIAGINIGKNKESANALADYLLLLERAYPYADYVTVNISSPNTPGLRDLQERAALEALVTALVEKRNMRSTTANKKIPLLIKIAPDLTVAQLEDVATVALTHGVDGLVLGNTTTARPPTLRSPKATQQGGLSGKPLFEHSTNILRQLRRLTQGKIVLVGVGGIASGEDAYAKIKAGASLVQLYTALSYQGFGLVTQINNYLEQAIARDGFKNISEAVGIEL